jgi:hypothetical protein
MAPIRCIEERWNGVLRDRLNVRTRKTHAFAKTTGAWDAWVILCWFEHNGLRPHRALRAQADCPETGHTTTGYQGFELNSELLKTFNIKIFKIIFPIFS